MKLSICGLICIFLLTFSIFTRSNDPTTLTYYVEYEEEQEEDYI